MSSSDYNLIKRYAYAGGSNCGTNVSGTYTNICTTKDVGMGTRATTSDTGPTGPTGAIGPTGASERYISINKISIDPTDFSDNYVPITIDSGLSYIQGDHVHVKAYDYMNSLKEFNNLVQNN